MENLGRTTDGRRTDSVLEVRASHSLQISQYRSGIMMILLIITVVNIIYYVVFQFVSFRFCFLVLNDFDTFHYVFIPITHI